MKTDINACTNKDMYKWLGQNFVFVTDSYGHYIEIEAIGETRKKNYC